MNSVVERHPLLRENHSDKTSGRIGALLVEAGKLTSKDVEVISKYQQTHSMPFGEAGIRLKLISEPDVREVLSRQFDYPYLRNGQSTIAGEVVAAYQPFSPFVEELRGLRSQLLLRHPQQASDDARVLVVGSVARGDGRSYVAANLAVVFSQLGERTLLIDADLRNPSQHVLFAVEPSVGLSTHLSGRSSLNAIQTIGGLAHLSLLVAGPVPPNPQELLSRSSFAHLLAGVCRDYDTVIIDTSAAEVAADVVTLATRASAALLIARQDHTQLARLNALGREMDEAGARVLGCILNIH
jgi:protein-tyrosine kinase